MFTFVTFSLRCFLYWRLGDQRLFVDWMSRCDCCFCSHCLLFTVVDCVAEVTLQTPRDPCTPSPCGPNALCRNRHGAGSCVCAPGYFGDPWAGCRPECVLNSDCPWDRACINNKCRDPCPGACGLNAECRVSHHTPVCFCLQGHTGNPLASCRPIVVEYCKPLCYACSLLRFLLLFPFPQPKLHNFV